MHSAIETFNETLALLLQIIRVDLPEKYVL